ncbi:MAG TPA: hypothetical protein VMM17_03330 [Gemmatimonadaceae bacterium]|nr:hypothetical protein [Gemmatimonadaceae bacterium]
MPNPDLSSRAPGESTAGTESSRTSPQIVYLSASFDLSEFPSETSDPAEPTTTPDPEDAWHLNSSEPAAPADETAADEFAVQVPEVDSAEPLPATLPSELTEPTTTPNREHASQVNSSEPPAPADETAAREFAVQIPEVDGPKQPHASIPSDPVTLVDLLERVGAVGWREAVAIVYQLCLQLKDTPRQAPILVEPRNVQITSNGEVRVLAGQPGGDLLVIQLGRLLRTMLTEVSTPPELRLLIAQATFEMPIFESVEDLARALQHMDRFEDSEAVRTAFQRASQPPAQPPNVAEDLSPPGRPILPPRRERGRKIAARAIPRAEASHKLGSPLMVALLIVLLATSGLLVMRSSWLPRFRSPGTSLADRAVTAGEGDGAAIERVSTGIEALQRRAPEPSRAPQLITSPQPAPRTARRPSSAGPAAIPGIDSVDGKDSDAAAPGPRRAPGPPRATARVTAAPSARDLVTRAATLMGEGRAPDATVVFDMLVMTHPLYEPGADALTPDSLAAFRNSRRLLLPSIAVREYDRAKAALAAGDVDRAVQVGRQASAILDRIGEEAPAELHGRVRQLLSDANDLRSAAEQVVYSRGDADVVPPRPLSRQFPLALPVDVPPQRIGVLDMVIGKAGDVEFVKLYTPLNRYHERMIVSAAKAWRYEPALKGGTPVRFRLTVTITLPESGTFR